MKKRFWCWRKTRKIVSVFVLLASLRLGAKTCFAAFSVAMCEKTWFGAVDGLFGIRICDQKKAGEILSGLANF